MTGTIDKLIYDRVTQRASVRRKKARPSRPALATSFDVEASFSIVHMSPTSFSQRDESFVPTHDALEVQLVDVVPDVYPVVPSDTSLLYLYANNIVRHVWDEDVK